MGALHTFSIIILCEPSSNELYSSKCICVPGGTSACAKLRRWFAIDNNPSRLADIVTSLLSLETFIE